MRRTTVLDTRLDATTAATASPFRRQAPAQETMPMRASEALQQPPPDGPSNRPHLLTPKQLCAVYPIKPRTLKHWLQHSVDREVSQQGKKRTLPGNGLAPAILRKGRLIFIDEDLFLAWLYGRA
jgi:hypothetical protein